MASDTESLRVAKDDLTQLKGKQVELQREHRRLTNQKEVFEEQLKRIENELTTVEEELTCVSEERWLATKKVAWFRLKLFFQTVAQCLRCIYTLLTFAFVNLLNVLYVALTVSAELTRTLLETQGRQSVPHHNETENYRKTSTCFT